MKMLEANRHPKCDDPTCPMCEDIRIRLVAKFADGSERQVVVNTWDELDSEATKVLKARKDFEAKGRVLVGLVADMVSMTEEEYFNLGSSNVPWWMPWWA